ncbi:MAG TPA: hypothetical protein VKB46_21450 [Pyrinomonadaceae bacterium]|nr:hypothetical protein [Pyrinomonadaceae bacterium]
MKIKSCFLALTLGCSVAAHGQTTASNRPQPSGKKSATASALAPEKTPVRMRRIWLSLTMSTVYDSNLDHDQASLNSFGFVPSVGLHYRDNPEKPNFEADYEVGLHRYTNSDIYDRVSQNLELAYRKYLGRKWQARTTGVVSLKGSSEDRDVDNEYVLEQQLQYRFNPANRLRFYGAYRVKRYPAPDIEKNAVDPYFGARFDHRLAQQRRWEVSYRYDKNRSAGVKDRYVRWTYGALFSTPVRRSLRDLLTLELRYAPRLYARQIKVDGSRVARKDQRWVFDAVYERPLSTDVRMAFNYRYETRSSNDVEKNFNSHLLGVTFGFDWWK